MSKDQDSAEKIQRLLDHIAALEEERDRFKKRDWNYQAVFDRVTDQLAVERPRATANPGKFEGLSIVVAYYDIPRQIERTLTTCSPAYQGADDGEIEVILVDNGSPSPLPDDLQERFPHVTRILTFDGHPSPVHALNEGIKAARFEMIGVMIDGAHMLSPGVTRNAREIWHLFDNPVINVPQFILGEESQNLTRAGDAFEKEAEALAELGWPQDGYRLFDYAVYPGENYNRSYVEAIETNCLISTRRVFEEYGAFDERFDEEGAGFANLELFSRLIDNPNNLYVTLAGEGTFHQDHRGTTTQRSPEERDLLVAQFKRRFEEVTGSDMVLNARSPFLYGKTRRFTQRVPTISRSFGKERDRILKQLANIYVARIRGGMTDDYRPVLSVGGAPDERLARTPLPAIGLLPEAAKRNGVEEKILSYLRCLKQVHIALRPSLYFEIGVDTGSSLRLAECPAIGVDPSYVIQNELQSPARLFRQTSDTFFADTERCARLFGSGIELAFIDGMHLAEFVLRDFIETEKWMKKGGIIMFDDVLPEQMEMLERNRRFNAWCGDVYKIIPILRRYRPDLTVSVFETFIGPYRKGLAVVSGVDPKNRVLETRYTKIEEEIMAGRYDVASIRALDKLLEPEPISGLEAAVSGITRGGAVDLKACLSAASAPAAVTGKQVPKAPELSLVVVAHNMARELPRTLRTLSVEMQNGIAADDVEIIVVDNGSSDPADLEACLREVPNAAFISLPKTGVSPCHAANVGIAAARADKIGVMIDGARMASPGLLRAAIDALGTGDKTVVGAHGFHLGREVQSEALKNGYDADAEDALLTKSGWETDGYRLFDISVFSKSSGKGWHTLPSETNALFMHRALWIALNGYDERFAALGGGLANLDIWKRACELDDAKVRILGGEGTFHQIHGGASSNAAVSLREEFDREYIALRGKPYERPRIDAEFLGEPRQVGQSGETAGS
ncbi:MAG: glycosyltransferase [Pseudomonadota bacterium]